MEKTTKVLLVKKEGRDPDKPTNITLVHDGNTRRGPTLRARIRRNKKEDTKGGTSRDSFMERPNNQQCSEKHLRIVIVRRSVGLRWVEEVVEGRAGNKSL